MDLNRIRLTKLFGAFNHEISLNKDIGITLVLGENGLGKTVILKLLKIVFEGNFMDLKNYDFERMDLDFDDFKYSFFGSVDPDNERLIARMYRGKNKIQEMDFMNSEVFEPYSSGRLFDDSDFLFENDFIIRSKHSPELEYVFDKYLSRYVHRVSKDEWIDHRTGRLMSTRAVLNRYGRTLPPRYRNAFTSNVIPTWLDELSQRVKIYLIETQRLRTKKSSDSYQDAVISISKELSQKVKGLLATANEHASQLDRSYPTRLLSKIDELENISDEDLEARLTLLEKRREKLRKVGLVDPSEDEIPREPVRKGKNESTPGNELIKNVFLVYIEDSNSKLDIYDSIADKLEVFLEILNERLNVKSIQIDRDKGLIVKSEKFNRDIPLAGLSSGEQHMIILFYNLLFKCEENSLILIDEPEISLHISWQNNFINDLLRIKTITPFEVIIATHSPDIIDENWNLTVSLKEE